MENNSRQEIATLDLRMAAALIDYGILLLAFAIIAGILGMIFGNSFPHFTSILSATTGAGLWFAYLGYFHQGPWRATIGKRIMKIHLATVDGSVIDWRLSLKRALALGGWALLADFIFMLANHKVGFFDTVLVLQMLASIIMIWKAADRAAIHDKICKTLVVKGLL